MVSAKLARKLAELKYRQERQALQTYLETNPALEFIEFVEDKEGLALVITLLKQINQCDAVPDFTMRNFLPSTVFDAWLLEHIRPVYVGEEVFLWFFDGFENTFVSKVVLLSQDWFNSLLRAYTLEFLVLSSDWRTGYALVEEEYNFELFILDERLEKLQLAR